MALSLDTPSPTSAPANPPIAAPPNAPSTPPRSAAAKGPAIIIGPIPGTTRNAAPTSNPKSPPDSAPTLAPVFGDTTRCHKPNGPFHGFKVFTDDRHVFHVDPVSFQSANGFVGGIMISVYGDNAHFPIGHCRGHRYSFEILERPKQKTSARGSTDGVDKTHDFGRLTAPEMSGEPHSAPSGVPFSTRFAFSSVASFAFGAVAHVTILFLRYC